jgi:hypothetical protein
MLRGFDVGVALMYTPHPSLVPLEMASAGMTVVTNTCENKTAGALSAISENLVPAEPSIEGIAGSIREAIERSGEVERRVRGADLDWPTEWKDSFHDEVTDRIVAFLDAC